MYYSDRVDKKKKSFLKILLTFQIKTTTINRCPKEMGQKTKAKRSTTNRQQEDKIMATMVKKLVNAYMNASLVKLMVGFLIVIAIALSVSVNANATPKHNHKTEKRTEYAVTIDVSVKDGLTYVKTSDGYIWTFSESDSDVGDVYRVTFDTMNTKRKSDDRIVSVRYIGYVFNVENS